MLISRAFDLQALATKDDRLVLAFAKTGRDESGNSGRVLYVAVHGVDRNFECFVYQPQPGAEYSCMSEKDATHSLTVTNGMVTPVNGVLTSTFGPRRHPILNVGAAAQGRGLARARRHADHGRVRRDDRVRRRRQGLWQCDPHRAWRRQGNRLCPYEPLRAGHRRWRQGEGRRRDRLCRHDRALDRTASAFRDLPERRCGRSARQRRCRRGAGSGPAPASASAAGSDGSAVELLVNRIIHVESGGNARAKNPQFVGDRPWPVHQVDLAAHDEDLPARARQIDVGGASFSSSATIRPSRAKWSPISPARTRPG